MSKVFKLHLLRVIVLSSCGGMFACGSADRQPPSAVNTTFEATQVRAVVDQFFAAAKRQDWDAAADLMSSDFELYTDNAQYFPKDAYVRLLKEDDIQTRKMELKDLDIRVSTDGEMAWCKYRGLFESSSHGKASNVETAETLIFKKEAGLWKINRAHASVKFTSTHVAADQNGLIQ